MSIAAQRAQRRWSIRGALFAMAALAALPLLIFGPILLWQYAKSGRARAEAELIDDARGTARAIDSRFTAVESVLNVLAGSPLLDAPDLAAYERLLRNVAERTGYTIGLLEPDGRQIINTLIQPGTQLPRSDPSRWAPAIAERRPYVTNMLTSTTTGEPAVAVVMPVVRDGRIKWTLNIALFARDFADVMLAPGVPSHWIVSIVDRNGTHLVRSHQSETFAGRPLVPILIAHMKEKGGGTLRTTSLEGIPLISTVAWAPRSGWAAAIGRPVAELDEPLWREQRNLVLLGLGLLAATMAFAWLIGREINRSVAMITHQAASLARAEPVVAETSPLQETATIGAALAKASAELQARDTSLLALAADLEAQVAARTAEAVAEIERREASEQRFSVLVQGVVDYALIMLDPKGRVISWNAGAERLKGYGADEIIGEHFGRFYAEEDRAAGRPEHALEVAAQQGKFETEAWRLRKDGSRFWAHVLIDAIRNRSGELVGFAKVTRDITERREAQSKLDETRAQLAQSQKMEAIGQLTGGIAHDFNNMLAVVLGSLRLLERRLKRGEPNPQEFIDAARNGAERAATLTRRLLAFARRQPLAPEAIDLNRLLSSMSEMLRRTIPENIEIETVLAGGLWRTHIDRQELESALLNIVVNARDAMPDGGKLTIETANAHLDEAYAARHSDVTAGQYVLLAISDTGGGMSAEVAERAFDPFFTTKPAGQGTGLGLSQVHGFVRQSGGHVKLYSEPGEGVTVKLYLPRSFAATDAEPKSEQERRASLPSARSNEVILVVEDDAGVMDVTVAMLGELGYRTLSAPGPAAALKLLDSNHEVEVMLTDIVMPGMNGRRLAEAAVERRPDLKVVYMTGYTRNAVVHHGVVDPDVELIQKPFTLETLANKLEQVLGSRQQE